MQTVATYSLRAAAGLCQNKEGRVTAYRLTGRKHHPSGLAHKHISHPGARRCHTEEKHPSTDVNTITPSLSSVAAPQVLHCCVSSAALQGQLGDYLLGLSGLSADYELVLGQVRSFEPPPSQQAGADFGNLLTVAEGKNTRPLVSADRCTTTVCV